MDQYPKNRFTMIYNGYDRDFDNSNGGCLPTTRIGKLLDVSWAGFFRKSCIGNAAAMKMRCLSLSPVRDRCSPHGIVFIDLRTPPRLTCRLPENTPVSHGSWFQWSTASEPSNHGFSRCQVTKNISSFTKYVNDSMNFLFSLHLVSQSFTQFYAYIFSHHFTMFYT